MSITYFLSRTRNNKRNSATQAYSLLGSKYLMTKGQRATKQKGIVDLLFVSVGKR
jgi:hypothetical protein